MQQTDALQDALDLKCSYLYGQHFIRSELSPLWSGFFGCHLLGVTQSLWNISLLSLRLIFYLGGKTDSIFVSWQNCLKYGSSTFSNDDDDQATLNTSGFKWQCGLESHYCCLVTAALPAHLTSHKPSAVLFFFCFVWLLLFFYQFK